jgi:NADPH:quinone reductase
MRRLDATDGVLRLVNTEALVAAPDGVVAHVDVIGVNFRNVREARGDYGVRTLQGEGAGRVTAVGAEVEDIQVGDRIAWTSATDHYAEEVAVAASTVIPIPEDIATDVAAAVLLQGMTAHYLTHDAFRVAPGQVALVHAAAGGVGLLLTQTISRLGGSVIATTSTPEKAALATAAGAKWSIPYDAFAEQVQELTGGRGVDVIYDGVGRSTLLEGFKALCVRGTLVLFGASSGEPDPIDTRVLFRNSQTLMRTSLRHFDQPRSTLLARAGAVFDWVRDGKLKVQIGGRYAFADAQRAHDDLEQRRSSGKLLIIVALEAD